MRAFHRWRDASMLIMSLEASSPSPQSFTMLCFCWNSTHRQFAVVGAFFAVSLKALPNGVNSLGRQLKIVLDVEAREILRQAIRTDIAAQVAGHRVPGGERDSREGRATPADAQARLYEQMGRCFRSKSATNPMNFSRFRLDRYILHENRDHPEPGSSTECGRIVAPSPITTSPITVAF